MVNTMQVRSFTLFSPKADNSQVPRNPIWKCKLQRITQGNWFSLSIMWSLGIQLRPWGLLISTFPHKSGPFLFLILFLFIWLMLPVCMYVHHLHAWCPWRAGKVVGFSGVTVGWWVLGIQSRSSRRAASAYKRCVIHLASSFLLSKCHLHSLS
jgi:hypothetical protein